MHGMATRKDSPYHSTKMMGEHAYKAMKEMIDYYKKYYE